MTENKNSKSLSNYQFEKCHKERVQSHSHPTLAWTHVGALARAVVWPVGLSLAKDLGSGEVLENFPLLLKFKTVNFNKTFPLSF